MTPRFEIRRSKRLGRQRWRVVLVARNGEPLYVSEHLNSRDAAFINIRAVRAAARTQEIVEV